MNVHQPGCVVARECTLALRRGRCHRGTSIPRLLVGVAILGFVIAVLARVVPPGAVLTPAAAAEERAKDGNPAAPASPQNRCLSRQEQRARVAAHAAVPLGKAMQAVKGRGDLLRARLCERQGKLLYLLTMLSGGGKILRIAVDARTGRPLGTPN